MSSSGWTKWCGRYRVFLSVLCLVVVSLTGFVGCDKPSGDSASLLANKAARKSEGVNNAERLVDGVVPPVGSAWNSNRTTTFKDRRAYVEYDLGAETKIAALALMGDNNDTYRVSGSMDGAQFSAIWTAPRVSQSGMRWRTVNDLDGKARFKIGRAHV